MDGPSDRLDHHVAQQRCGFSSNATLPSAGDGSEIPPQRAGEPSEGNRRGPETITTSSQRNPTAPALQGSPKEEIGAGHRSRGAPKQGDCVRARGEGKTDAGPT